MSDEELVWRDPITGAIRRASPASTAASAPPMQMMKAACYAACGEQIRVMDRPMPVAPEGGVVLQSVGFAAVAHLL